MPEPTTTPNFPALKRLNLYIQAQAKLPKEARVWYQGYWVVLERVDDPPMCKTGCCAAGVALVQAGHKLMIDRGKQIWLDDHMINDGRIPHLADQALGLNHGGIYGDGDNYHPLPPYDLYDAENEAADIDQIIRGIFTTHGVNYHQTKSIPDHEVKVTVVSS